MPAFSGGAVLIDNGRRPSRGLSAVRGESNSPTMRKPHANAAESTTLPKVEPMTRGLGAWRSDCWEGDCSEDYYKGRAIDHSGMQSPLTSVSPTTPGLPPSRPPFRRPCTAPVIASRPHEKRLEESTKASEIRGCRREGSFDAVLYATRQSMERLEVATRRNSGFESIRGDEEFGEEEIREKMEDERERLQLILAFLEGHDPLAAATAAIRSIIRAGCGPLAKATVRPGGDANNRCSPANAECLRKKLDEATEKKLRQALDCLEGCVERTLSCQSAQARRLSQARRVSYVELVDENKKELKEFTHTISMADELDDSTKAFLQEFGTSEKKKKHKTFREVAMAVKISLFMKKLIRKSPASNTETSPSDFLFSKVLSRKTDLGLQKQLDQVSRWNEFDIFKVDSFSDQNALKCTGYTVLKVRGLFDHFNISESKFVNFVGEIEDLYQRRNPYHNAIHGADVVQTTHCFLSGKSSVFFSELEVLTALFAAVCHDVSHPGVTNNFRVAVRDEMAITYNDRSVNENMHCAVSYRTLQAETCRWVEVLSRDQEVAVRKLLVLVILATDMAFHFENLQVFNSIIADRGDDVTKWDSPNKALEWVVHAADISSTTKVFDVAQRWTDRVLEEFFMQGDEELARGLPISPLCDRNTVSKVQSQCGFVSFIVRPTFEALAHISDIVIAIQNLDIYTALYKKRLAEEKEQEKTRQAD